LLSGSTILGQQGKIVLAFATPTGQPGPVAHSCWPISSNVFTADVTYMTEVPAGDPCSGSTPEVVLPFGVYDITAGVYTGGSQVPEKTVTLQISVSGDQYSIFDGVALSVEPPGDANCDMLVNAVDITAALASLAQIPADTDCLDSANVICTDALDTRDVLALLIYSSGAEPTLPGSCPPLLRAPRLISPADGAVFDVFPREVPAEWDPVPGAAAYYMQLDYFGGCYPFEGWCSDDGTGWQNQPGIVGTEFVFNVGARGEARWRLAAVGADGRFGPFSEWRTLEHLQ
jgi:hypothetical protein